ncbi:hypothetical protein [Paenibacillus protaetiae]|uniref:Uncharacterized protein n=1 Tax=Paenibacillus protaetiae TaxID=2509456 RepID=A0A4P6ETV9_9BACL|nr:hypothetical protein [Paenibacillus protaetiae]QAY65895.1 hypothetical protein ET464_05360 [Paenibacillus protaetiae]
MTLILRYTNNVAGDIIFTGNTLGLSRSNNVGQPGTVDSIGAYVTIDTSRQFGTYPSGTTDDFNLNSSTAILRLPAGSTVLYAELVWAGLCRNPSSDLTPFIDKTVNLTVPNGSTFAITPDPATAQTVVEGNLTNYVRSADVTAIVQGAEQGRILAAALSGRLRLTMSLKTAAAGRFASLFRTVRLRSEICPYLPELSGWRPIKRSQRRFPALLLR